VMPLARPHTAPPPPHMAPPHTPPPPPPPHTPMPHHHHAPPLQLEQGVSLIRTPPSLRLTSCSPGASVLLRCWYCALVPPDTPQPSDVVTCPTQ
jgi:hypothetical protein